MVGEQKTVSQLARMDFGKTGLANWGLVHFARRSHIPFTSWEVRSFPLQGLDPSKPTFAFIKGFVLTLCLTFIIHGLARRSRMEMRSGSLSEAFPTHFYHGIPMNNVGAWSFTRNFNLDQGQQIQNTLVKPVHVIDRDPSTYAYLNKSRVAYPFGINDWSFYNDNCDDNTDGVSLRKISFAACKDSEFSCNDGTW